MTKNTVLIALRQNTEATQVDADGTKWGVVYLDNVDRGHAFAGYLSALAKDGEYKPMNDQQFGLVRIVEAPAEPAHITVIRAINDAAAQGNYKAAIAACNAYYKKLNASRKSMRQAV